MSIDHWCRMWRTPCCLLGLIVGMLSGLPCSWSADVQPFRYDGHGRRDPFEPLVTSTGELRTPRSGNVTGMLHLEGVLWDPQQPMAIVNGTVLRVGDEVEGYHLVEIRPEAIVVDGGEAGRLVIPVTVEGTGSAPQE